MAYALEISPAARRELKKIRGPIVQRIGDAIDGLADVPRPAGSLKLVDEADLYRLRVGDYRIVYQIHDDRLIVLVVRVAHRRDVYRGDA